MVEKPLHASTNMAMSMVMARGIPTEDGMGAMDIMGKTAGAMGRMVPWTLKRRLQPTRSLQGYSAIVLGRLSIESVIKAAGHRCWLYWTAMGR